MSGAITATWERQVKSELGASLGRHTSHQPPSPQVRMVHVHNIGAMISAVGSAAAPTGWQACIACARSRVGRVMSWPTG